MLDKGSVAFIKSGDLPKVLLMMGFPILAGMLVTALYNVVDAWFVAGLGTYELAAVSAVFPIPQVIIGVGLIFGTGSASYMARLLGSEDLREASKTASTAVFLGIVTGGILIFFSLLFLNPLLGLLGATGNTYVFARSYGTIILLGSVLNIVNITCCNLFSAQGKVRITMFAMFLGAGLNILLDPLCIYTFGMGVDGAGVATVLSQGVTTFFLVRIFQSKENILTLSPRLVSLEKKILGEIFKVGLPIFGYQLLTGIALSMTNHQAALYGGDEALAAMGVVTRIMALGAYVVFGFIKGFQIVVGVNYGARLEERVRRGIRLMLRWGTVFCLVFGTCAVFFSGFLASQFARGNPEVLRVGMAALQAHGALFITFAFQTVYASVFLAMGKGREAALLNLSRQGIFFLPSILVLPLFFGVNGVIWAQPLGDVMTTLTVFTLVTARRQVVPLY